jgi:hypothetical protein
MPLRRLGLVTDEESSTGQENMEFLPWKDTLEEKLTLYLDQQPSKDDLARVEAYQVAPMDFFDNPHLRIKSLESEMAHMFKAWMGAVESVLDEESACKVAYAVGRTHGKRRLTTFRNGQGLPPGSKTMAMWQDTGHSCAGTKHTSALFARYNDNVVEISRTEDSFGAHTGKDPEAMKAFFDGFIDGYQDADPELRSVEELTRKLPDGRLEFVHRFWYIDRD